MTICSERSGSIRPQGLFCLVIMLIIALQPISAAAENAAQKQFQSILRDSLEDLWTGREFSPELQKRQQTLTSMLSTGAVEKTQLENMMEAAVFSILDRHKTSRYILKDMPGRVDSLFSPYASWQDVKEITWRAAASVADKNDPLTIKLGTLAPPGTPWLNVPETVALPEIERLSDGKIVIKIYAGGVMGEDTDILRKMDIGQLDSCGCTALGVLAASPDTSALLIPGLFKNYEEIDYITEKFRKRLDQAFEEKGYILAALIDTGYFYMFSKNKITSLADLRKQKVVTWFGAMETTLYEALDINATPVAVPEIISALSTGLADTNLGPSAWMLGMQAYQYVNYYLKPPLLYSPAAVIVSAHTKDRFQKQAGISETFSHNIQELLVAEFNRLEPEWKAKIRNYEAKSLKAFESKCGIKPMTLSAADQKTLAQAGKVVQQKLAGKVLSKELMNDILNALKDYRATH